MNLKRKFCHHLLTLKEFQTCMNLFCQTQRKIFWRKFGNSFGAPLTSIVKKKYYGSQPCPRTALFPTFFRISSFVFGRANSYRFGTTWEWVNDRIFIYGWNIPLTSMMKNSDAKASKCCLKISSKFVIFLRPFCFHVQFFHFNGNEKNAFIGVKVKLLNLHIGV